MRIGILPYFPPVTRLSALLETLAKTPEEARAENLRRWSASISGTTAIGNVEPRTHQKVAGVVQNIRIDPRPTSRSIEATIIDGTGQMVVRWLGRPQMPGISLGAGLVVSGVVGRTSDGEPLILNPDHDLVKDPEHG